MTDTYNVLAKRWNKGWELHIEGVGVTQARRPREAEEMVRDLIARREEVAENSFELTWTFEVNAELDAKVKDARAAVEDLSTVQRETASKSRAVARQLADAGLAKNEVAWVMDVSPQRVSQLLRAHTTTTATMASTTTLASAAALLMTLMLNLFRD